MVRPALQLLIKDIKAKRIDIVLVYKVDRLTRSLHDFARLMDLFDTHKVSFVSVTQSFNTTSSMGRLTLNVLLSFAQFEREVTSERIRDKIAASKKKGLYMGGTPPLGYQVKDKKLIVDRPEAKTVLFIYRSFIKLSSVTALKHQLDQSHMRTKAWINAKGEKKGDQLFTTGHLRYILRNPLYIGKTVHKHSLYEGEHKSIVSQSLFDKVQAIFESQKQTRQAYTATKGFLLKGRLFDDKHKAMSPHTTQTGKGKTKKQYTYYVSQALLKGDGERAGSLPRVSAKDFDVLIHFHIGKLLKGPRPFLRGLGLNIKDGQIINAVTTAFLSLSEIWDKDIIEQQQAVLEQLGLKILISDQSLLLRFQTDSFRSFLSAADQFLNAHIKKQAAAFIEIPISISLKRTKSKTKIILPKLATQRHQANPALVKAVVQAHLWHQRLMSGEIKTIRDVAKIYGYTERQVGKILRLATLAPDIVEAILEGAQPPDLTLQALTMPLPFDWPGQRQVLGFAA